MFNCYDKNFTCMDDNGNTIKVKGISRKVTIREISTLQMKIYVCVIIDFTTPGESYLYGLPLSRCRLLRPIGPFFVL